MCSLSVLWEKFIKPPIKQSAAMALVKIIAMEKEMLSADTGRMIQKKS